MLIALCVVDLLIVGNDTSATVRIKGKLSRRFETKDLGEAQVSLPLEIYRDRGNGTLRLSQEKYTHSIL